MEIACVCGETERTVLCLLVVRGFVVAYQTYMMAPFFVQVRGLLANVDVEGRMHDFFGATGDAVGKVMNANGFHVSTNYVNSRCV